MVSTAGRFYRALYVQDSWKISSRLTLNYGVRWEPYTAVYQKYVAPGSAFRSGIVHPERASSYYQNSPAGWYSREIRSIRAATPSTAPSGTSFSHESGLAWDPKGNGRMTIRAAYGMLGDRMSMLSLSQEQFGAPFGSTISVPGANLNNPWANFAGGAGGLLPAGQNPLAILAAQSGFGNVAPNIPFITAGSYISSPLSDFKPTYMNQWNVSIQKQVGQSWLLTANYLGNSTIHMVSGTNVNPAHVSRHRARAHCKW